VTGARAPKISCTLDKASRQNAHLSCATCAPGWSPGTMSVDDDDRTDRRGDGDGRTKCDG